MEQREVPLYVSRCSLRCWRARCLIARSGYGDEVVDMTKGCRARGSSSSLGAPTARRCHTSSSTTAR